MFRNVTQHGSTCAWAVTLLPFILKELNPAECVGRAHGTSTVEPRLADTPEMRTSTMMQTLCLVQNAISIGLHTSRPPEMQTPHYSVKRTLGLAPTI